MFHVRILFILTVFPFILLIFKSYWIQHPNELSIGSWAFWTTLTITLIVLFLMARIILNILLTYKGDTKFIFSKNDLKISGLDIYGGLLVTFLIVFLFFLDYTPFRVFFYTSYITTKEETHPIKDIDKGINTPITFNSQNTTIEDSKVNHNFTSYKYSEANATQSAYYKRKMISWLRFLIIHNLICTISLQ